MQLFTCNEKAVVTETNVNCELFYFFAVSSDHMSPRPPFPHTEDEFLIADFMRGASYTKYIYCLVFLSVL